MKMILLVLVTLLLLPAFAHAVDQGEPAVYVIKQGDTLWGLSERFIKDPEYWPELWSKNGQVTNPHFIYPEQKLRVFPDRLELAPKETTPKETAPALPEQKGVAVTAVAVAAPTAEAPRDVAVEKTYVLYGTEGFLAEKGFRPAGRVIGIQHDRVVAGIDDILYTDIGTDQNAGGGDKFSMFLKEASVSHPANSEEMGFKMIPLGVLQLTDMERKSSRAIIIKSIREASPGAFLLPYKDNGRREVTLKNGRNDLRGYIIESLSGTGAIAAGDVVYIDLGSSQGAEAGNMLYIVRDVTIDQRYVEGRIEKLPQELLGALVILATGNKTSAALVVKSIDAIHKGDRIVSLTK